MKNFFQDKLQGNNCYGCGARNEKGLKIKSFWEKDEAVCIFQPKNHHAAMPPDVMNGGTISTLIDCHCVCSSIADAYQIENREIGEGEDIRYATGSLKIDFKVSDKNLSETVAIQILLPQGDLYADITSLSYNTTNVFASPYDLQIIAKDLAGNEAVETVPFTVDHSFIQKPIEDIKPEIQESNIPIIVISIVIITIIIAFVAIKKARTKHDQDKTLKQDLYPIYRHLSLNV